jgi:hypothetical protein
LPDAQTQFGRALRELDIELIRARSPQAKGRVEGYKERRHFHYDIIIGNLAEFPRGLYVEMELANTDEDDPTVNLLNAHPPRP